MPVNTRSKSQSSLDLPPTSASVDYDFIVSKVIEGVMPCLKSLLSKVSGSIDEISSKVDTVTSKLDELLLRIGIAEKKIDDLYGRVNNLEVKVTKIENVSVESERNSKTVSRDCFVELEERFSRKKNLVLFGLSEANNRVDDDNRIKTLFSTFSPPVLLDNINLSRIGLVSQGQTKPRPVKIKCNSEEQASKIHRTFVSFKRNDKSTSCMDNLWLTWDKTKLQLEELSCLKKEIVLRRQKGVTNIGIYLTKMAFLLLEPRHM